MTQPGASDGVTSSSAKVECAESLLLEIGVEVGHCQQVALLADQLFAETASLHDLGEAERGLLVAGALLHDVGISVSYQGHHKNSRDIILEAELPGLTGRERGIIANIARYHRKAHPRGGHKHFADLGRSDRELVRVLAAMVRIADGLDRSHSDVVQRVSARCVEEAHWEIVVSGQGSMATELWAAREKKRGLLEEAFGIRVSIVAAR